MITQLINKQDNFEIIRDQIAAILALECASQQTLARDAGLDPTRWAFNVFAERTNPYEAFASDPTPFVNVWYDGSTFPQGAGNTVEKQRAAGIFNIDCCALGVSEETATGHTPADEKAARDVQRVVRLVRNILMSGTYTYLGLRGLVTLRWPDSISIFQPQADAQTVGQIVAARIVFRVEFIETSPQVEPVTLETLAAKVTRAENGAIVINTEYIYNGS